MSADRPEAADGDGYIVSRDPALLDLPFAYRYLHEKTCWAKSRKFGFRPVPDDEHWMQIFGER